MPQFPGLGFELGHKVLAELGTCFFHAERSTQVCLSEKIIPTNSVEPKRSTKDA